MTIRISRAVSALIGGAALLGWMSVAAPSMAAAQSLRGSKTSVARQHRVAKQHDYTHLKTAKQVRKFVDMGLLVRLPGGDYEISGASFPYARPAVKLFVERLSRQYRAATGERLVITSLTRPVNRQPRNASQISVHPTGMAMDIRRSRSAAARRWLEKTLLILEKRGVIEATYERHPPHYHVAVFPTQYEEYVAQKLNQSPRKKQSDVAQKLQEPSRKLEAEYYTYRVRRGDSLWSIAKDHGTTVGRIKQINAMDSARIYPGQTLMIPAT